MQNIVNDFLDDLRGGRMTETPIVRVEQGQLQGKVSSSPSGRAYFAFQGVPYAKPPLGSLRFKAPQPHEPWEGIREATTEGNVSAQIDFITKEYTGDENCLFLNIYTPTLDGSFLPVMVWFHGGGLFFGSGNSDFYGPDYLIEKDVVVVTVNYRLGPLGFLGLNTPEVPGNAGIKDMVQALRWIKENIQNFGGNAGNLTVFGESAGGGAVSLLTASPLSKNLINKAIIQSGNALTNWFTQKSPVDNAKKLAAALGCDGESSEEIMEFLTATPTKDIVEAHNKISNFDNALEKIINNFVVVVEKEFPGVEAVITEPFADLLKSGRVAQIPTMIGSTALEFAFERKHDDLQIFIPPELKIEQNSESSLAIAEDLKRTYFKDGSITDKEYYQLTSDKYINVDNHRYVQYLLQFSNIPVYLYKFDYVGELNMSKTLSISQKLNEPMHMDELGYLFRNDLQKNVEPTPQDLKVRERMVRLWTNFAKSGNPTPDENHYINVTWLPATKDSENYFHITQELALRTNYDQEKMKFWDGLYEKYYKVWEQPQSNAVVTSKSDLVTVETTIPDPVIVETTTSGPVIVETTTSDPVIVEVSKSNPVIIESSGSDPVIVETLTIVTTSSGSQSVETTTNLVEITSVVETSDVVESNNVVESKEEVDAPVVKEEPKEETKKEEVNKIFVENTYLNGNHERSTKRTSNEIKMVHNSNGVPKEVIRANDPPEDDLPKNIGVNKFVNFFESLGGKK